MSNRDQLIDSLFRDLETPSLPSELRSRTLEPALEALRQAEVTKHQGGEADGPLHTVGRDRWISPPAPQTWKGNWSNCSRSHVCAPTSSH